MRVNCRPSWMLCEFRNLPPPPTLLRPAADDCLAPFHSADDLGEEETETPSYLTSGASELPDLAAAPSALPEIGGSKVSLCLPFRRREERGEEAVAAAPSVCAGACPLFALWWCFEQRQEPWPRAREARKPQEDATQAPLRYAEIARFAAVLP
jgi:hypothetical protein